MIFNSRKNLSFAFLLFFAVLVSFGSVCAADSNNAGGNYTFGNRDMPTLPPHGDLGDLPPIGGDSVAVNDVNVDDNLNDCRSVLLDSGDDSAANDDSSFYGVFGGNIGIPDSGDFGMSVRFNAGTGYHWEISSESYGVDLLYVSTYFDHPDCVGSSATSYYCFHKNSEDYYVKLILIDPRGNIVDEVDSNMIN